MANKLRISESNRGIADNSSSPRLTSSIPTRNEGPVAAEKSKIKARKKNFFKSLWKGLRSEANPTKPPSSSPNLKQVSPPPPRYSEDALSRKIAQLEAERKKEKAPSSSSAHPKQQSQSATIAATCPPRGGVSKVDKVDTTRYAVVQMVVQEADDDAVARKLAQHDNPSSSLARSKQQYKPKPIASTSLPRGAEHKIHTLDATRSAVVQLVMQEADDDAVARKIAQHDNKSSLRRALTSDAAITRKATVRTSGGSSSLRRAFTADAAINRGTVSSAAAPAVVQEAGDAVAMKLSQHDNQSTLRRALTSDPALSRRARTGARGVMSSLRRALTSEGTATLEAQRRREQTARSNAQPKEQHRGSTIANTCPPRVGGSKVDAIDTTRYAVVQMVVQEADDHAVAMKVSQHDNQSTLRRALTSDRAPTTRGRNVPRGGLSSLRRALTDGEVSRRSTGTPRNIRRSESERSFPQKTGDLHWENVESALSPDNMGKDGKKDKTLANSKPAANNPLPPPTSTRRQIAGPGRRSPPPNKTLSFWPAELEALATADTSGLDTSNSENASPALPQPQLRPGAFSMIPSFVSDPAPQEEIPPELLPEMDESAMSLVPDDLARARSSTASTTTNTLPQAKPVTESDYESYSQLKQLQSEYASHEAQMAEMQKQLEAMQRVQQELDRLKEELPQADLVDSDKDKKKKKKQKNKEKSVASVERPKDMTDGEWNAYQYLIGL